MKTWTMPRIDVEAFAANEHVATCTDASGNIKFVCESYKKGNNEALSANDAYGCAQVRHRYFSGNAGTKCGHVFTIPEYQWSQFKGDAAYFTAAGVKVNDVDDADYYVSRREARKGGVDYVYVYSTVRNGYIQNENHFVGGGMNPNS